MMHSPQNKRQHDAGYLSSDVRFGNNGVFIFPEKGLHTIACDLGGWEHVSVSLASRIPTWDEMCWIKDQFWDPEDCVVQYHPPKSRYVNCHPFTLHLWRPTEAEFPQPPPIYVGSLT